MKTTLLIDFDGVLRHWPNCQLEALHKKHGLIGTELFDCAFSPELLLPTINGSQSHELWCAKVRDALALEFGQALASLLVDAWYHLESEIDSEFLRQIRNLLVDKKLVLVTNATSRLMTDIKGAAIERYFDLIINSADIQRVKPNKDYYLESLRQAEVNAAQCVYLDDSAENIQAAEALGITSHLHQDAEASLEFITAYFN